MEELTLREEVAKVSYECFTGFLWDDATENEKAGAYGHADKILELILARMFNQVMCHCHEKD